MNAPCRQTGFYSPFSTPRDFVYGKGRLTQCVHDDLSGHRPHPGKEEDISTGNPLITEVLIPLQPVASLVHVPAQTAGVRHVDLRAPENQRIGQMEGCMPLR
jgi:hypothetical protein